MTNELYEKVVAYRITMSVIKSMLKSNIITADEYSEIDTIIARENGLSSCTIFGETSG
ncbi:MAG: SHOCT domain-containing protein [Ruminococcus sp.]